MDENRTTTINPALYSVGGSAKILVAGDFMCVLGTENSGVGGGHIQKSLPSNEGYVAVRWGDVHNGGCELWIGGKIHTILGKNLDVTTSVPFKAGDILQLRETVTVIYILCFCSHPCTVASNTAVAAGEAYTIEAVQPAHQMCWSILVTLCVSRVQPPTRPRTPACLLAGGRFLGHNSGRRFFNS